MLSELRRIAHSGSLSPNSSRGSGSVAEGESGLKARPVGLHSNACCAATAALLAIAGHGGALKRAVLKELSLSAWRGSPLRLGGLLDSTD